MHSAVPLQTMAQSLLKLPSSVHYDANFYLSVSNKNSRRLHSLTDPPIIRLLPLIWLYSQHDQRSEEPFSIQKTFLIQNWEVWKLVM